MIKICILFIAIIKCVDLAQINDVAVSSVAVFETGNNADISTIIELNQNLSNDLITLLTEIPRVHNLTFTNISLINNFSEAFRPNVYRELDFGNNCVNQISDTTKKIYVSGKIVLINGNIEIGNNKDLIFEDNARIIVNGNIDIGNNGKILFGSCNGTLHVYGDLNVGNKFKSCGGLWVNGSLIAGNSPQLKGFSRSDTFVAGNSGTFENSNIGLTSSLNGFYNVKTENFTIPFDSTSEIDAFMAYPNITSIFPLIIFWGGGSGFQFSSNYSKIAMNMASRGYVFVVLTRFVPRSFPPFTLVNTPTCQDIALLLFYWENNPNQKPNVNVSLIYLSGHSLGGARALTCISGDENNVAFCNEVNPSSNCGVFSIFSFPQIKGVVHWAGSFAGPVQFVPIVPTRTIIGNRFVGWFRGGIDEHSGSNATNRYMISYNRYLTNNKLAFWIEGANHWTITNSGDPNDHNSPDNQPRIDDNLGNLLIAKIFDETIRYFSLVDYDAFSFFSGEFRAFDEYIPWDFPIFCNSSF